MQGSQWRAPASVSRDQLIQDSESLLAKKDIIVEEKEDVFRIEALGLEWDIGVVTYAPTQTSVIPIGRDNKKIGFFLLHGGSADFRFMAPLARLLAGKYGYKVASMTYPGRLNLNDPSRKWPGDTIDAEGDIRLPIWLAGETITRDQAELVEDLSLRDRYGIRFNARAKPGTTFYDRMAAWPVAFEEGMKKACDRHFPPEEYSIYVHGHSTGGPFVHMLTQRVENIAGVVGMENSPFGYIYQKMIGIEWQGPFNDLLLRTWRDVARYAGAEIYHQEGGKTLFRLAWLMETVLDDWEQVKDQPNFKAEYPLHYGSAPVLTTAAKVAAARLKFSENDTDQLVERYLGYTHELRGTKVKPVPPILLSIAKFSRDHRPEIYQSVVLPSFAKMTPAPRVEVTQFESGTHHYEHPERDLPFGLVPSIVELWRTAIDRGYFDKPKA